MAALRPSITILSAILYAINENICAQRVSLEIFIEMLCKQITKLNQVSIDQPLTVVQKLVT